MADDEQKEEKPEDEGQAYLRRQAVEFQVKIERLKNCGKKLPPGGIIYYNLQVMLQASGDELQSAIAQELGVPSGCVAVRLQLDKETEAVIPIVDLSMPSHWITGVKGVKGNPAELRQLTEMHTRGVVAKYSLRFNEIVTRRMQVFADGADGQE
jgi:hypothetical protein